MTAAGLDFVSGGRFILGLGASGPQVIEGWHGVPYDTPLRAPARSSRSAAGAGAASGSSTTAEVHDPAAGRPGHRARQAAEAASTTPVRERHPDLRRRARPEERRADRRDRRRLAADPLRPRRRRRRCGATSLAAGTAKRDPALGAARDRRRRHGRDRRRRRAGCSTSCGPTLALYIGGMGARGKNFYNDLAVRYGYEAEAEDDPGPLPRRQEGRGRGRGARRAACEAAIARRPGVLRRGADRRLRGGRRHHPDAAAPRRQPRGPPEDRGDHEARLAALARARPPASSSRRRSGVLPHGRPRAEDPARSARP